MGLFDNLKNKVVGAAVDLKNNLEELSMKDILTLCSEMKELKPLDSKNMVYSMAIASKCEALHDFDLEDLYLYLKKQGTLFKNHPAEKVVLDELIQRNIYIKSDNGTVSRNMLAKKRPK